MLKSSAITSIVTDFYNGTPVLLENNVKLSWDEQKLLLDSTLMSPRVKKYPMNLNYCKSFIKKVIQCIEHIGEEVHDELYVVYCEMVKHPCEQDTNFYKHYLISHNGDKFVVIKESPNLIVDGTTGLRTWEAALVLADWALSNKKHFADKNILELGSGLGMTGIVISKLCGPASFTFSDCHHKVLSALEENVVLNSPDVSRNFLNDNLIQFASDSGCELNILNLDWNTTHAAFPKTPDMIIGADIVYDSTIFMPLISVFKQVVNLNQDVQIVLVSTVRNQKTIEEFAAQLGKNNFKISMMTHQNAVNICWNENQEYNIMKIYI